MMESSRSKDASRRMRGLFFLRWILFCTAISCLLLSTSRLWVHLVSHPSLNYSLQYSEAIFTPEIILTERRKREGSKESVKVEAVTKHSTLKIPSAPKEANAESTARIADTSLTKQQREEAQQISENGGNILEKTDITHAHAATTNEMSTSEQVELSSNTRDSATPLDSQKFTNDHDTIIMSRQTTFINASTPSQKAVMERDPVSNFVEGTKPPINRTQVEIILDAFMTCTEPDPNQLTLGYYQRVFASGFRNQAMAFTSFVMYAHDNNFTQILLPTLLWKDLHGSGRGARHELLFDVVHWNSFHPILPRLVRHHSSFTHFNDTNEQWTIDMAEANATRPFAFGRQKQLWNRYRAYTKDVVRRGHAVHPAMRTIMKGAFKPHPDLQEHIDRLRGSIIESASTTASVADSAASTTNNTGTSKYMCLHARVEPDMQQHPMCRHHKVIHLEPIFQIVQTAFPDPPAHKLFIAINRPVLEAVAREKDPEKKNMVGLENLVVLNRARENGLWDGRVKVFEGGWPSLKKTRFKKFPSISGSIVDYFLALDSDVFIGTLVSSFSADIIATRFLRGNLRNHWYVPKGLQEATDENTTAPPRFRC